MQNAFKVVLLGAKGCGKTTLVSYLRNKVYTGRYITNFGIDIHPVTIQTQYGTRILNLWDMADSNTSATNFDIYCRNTDACIAMCDNKPASVTRMQEIALLFKNTTCNTPIILVQNKSELTPHVFITGVINISIKTQENLFGMLTCLMSLLIHKHDVVIMGTMNKKSDKIVSTPIQNNSSLNP